MVQQGTQTGAGQRIRVRGVSSVSLSNEPIFIIDGIRMSSNNGSTSFGNGGATSAASATSARKTSRTSRS